MSSQRPLVAISGCLLGENIRYNGGHCREDWVFRELSKHVDFISVCPELEMGLGVPREEVHLYRNTRDDQEVKLKTKKTGIDLTEQATKTYEKLSLSLKKHQVDGHILTRKSPTCGTDNVKTITLDNETLVTKSTGLYAKYLQEELPTLPLIDSGRIKNYELRENFIKKLFAHHRFFQLEQSISALQHFHKCYKYTLMEHGQDNLRKLGAIAANHIGASTQEVFQKYFLLFMETISIVPTRKNRVNAFMHVFGYFKNDLTSLEKKHILELMNDYQEGITNYLSVNSILSILSGTHEKEYLTSQFIFSPYPKELKLLKDIA